MTTYNPLLAGIVLSIASQGCMSTEYLATTNDLDALESILVTTKSAPRFPFRLVAHEPRRRIHFAR